MKTLIEDMKEKLRDQTDVKTIEEIVGILSDFLPRLGEGVSIDELTGLQDVQNFLQRLGVEPLDSRKILVESFEEQFIDIEKKIEDKSRILIAGGGGVVVGAGGGAVVAHWGTIKKWKWIKSLINLFK